jgi:hypothetical protein
MKRTGLATVRADRGLAGAAVSVGGAVKSRLTGKDLLARVIKEDPALTGKLAKLHPVLAGFAQQGLPDAVAGVVTLADAARMAEVPEERFVAYLNDEAELPSATRSGGEPRPDWLEPLRATPDLPRIDVTGDIAAHRDPFTHVMAFVDALGDAPGFALKAPFHPVPLRRVLAARGFASYAECAAPEEAEDGEWIVFFRRGRGGGAGAAAAGEPEAREWRAEGVVHIDVRGLEPPQPLVAILALLERPDCGDEVIVHHSRDPVFLYPELAERGWEWERVPAAEGEVRLRLTRAAN